MTKRYALRDDQWERIRDLLPGREGHVPAKDNRRFVEYCTAIVPAFPGVTSPCGLGISACAALEYAGCGRRCSGIADNV